MRYSAYVFDAYGTLFDVHSAVTRLADRVGPDARRGFPSSGEPSSSNTAGCEP
jgi:FMN phosphatase YigB (HAD superfamily)